MTRGGKRKGAGRPKGMPKTKVNYTLLPETVAEITRLAEDMSIKKGDVIDMAVKKMVEAE